MTRSDGGDAGGSQGAVSEELGRVEGVGEAGRGGGRIMINFWDDNSDA